MLSLEKYYEELKKLQEQQDKMEELVGHQASYDGSVFSKSPEPEIISGTIKEVHLVKGDLYEDIEPYWRVSIDVAPGSVHGVALECVTVQPLDSAEQ